MLLLISLVWHTAVTPAPATVTMADAGSAARSVACSSGCVADSLPITPPALPAQPTANAPLVFDGVTVIDVEHGRRIPNQRVVIVGNRIKVMGKKSAVSVPPSARIVNAAGKYMIPGLWDMHTHAGRHSNTYYPLFLSSGVTGIRDAGSPVPLDTLIMWRREILAGTRVGPPRQILSGQSIGGPDTTCHRQGGKGRAQTCVSDSADARHYVDSLKRAGADMIKPRTVSKALYFVIASEARRIHIPFGGHAENELAVDASDSGAKIVDHMDFRPSDTTMDIARFCWGSEPSASLSDCKRISDRFRHNGTWFVPTLAVFHQALPMFMDHEDAWSKSMVSNLDEPVSDSAFARVRELTDEFWSGKLPNGNWLHDSTNTTSTNSATMPSDSFGAHSRMRFIVKTGMPMLTGTDVGEGNVFNGAAPGKEMLPGYSLLTELAIYGAYGMPPAEILRAATLNPAKLLNATDSMGTVAKGKLADLVLLDADPIADITNVTTINAVVANGRYFDRAALDRLLVEVQAKHGQR